MRQGGSTGRKWVARVTRNVMPGSGLTELPPAGGQTNFEPGRLSAFEFIQEFFQVCNALVLHAGKHAEVFNRWSVKRQLTRALAVSSGTLHRRRQNASRGLLL